MDEPNTTTKCVYKEMPFGIQPTLPVKLDTGTVQPVSQQGACCIQCCYIFKREEFKCSSVVYSPKKCG